MNDLPLNALRAFAMVYTHGGVRAAARELGIAHSAVSHHLSELQRWLGIALIRPGPHRALAFTAQGEALGQAVTTGLNDIAQVITSVREARSDTSVVLSTTPSFAARWLLPRLPELERTLPHIELSIVVDQRLNDIETGDADLAIRIGRGPWPDARCEPLMNDALYPVMSPQLWERAGRPDHPAGLIGLRLLHDRDPQSTWAIWKQAHGPDRLDTRPGARLASSDLVLRAAAQSQGVALARHRLVADDLAERRLCRPLGSLQVDIGTAYWIVLPRRKRVRPIAMDVVEWLRRVCGRA